MKKRLTREALIHYYGSVVERLSLVPPGTPPRLLVPETDTLAPQEATVVGNILVASAEPKEGRTTTAIGLAFAAALLKPNKRILLVDLDLRHSRIHRLLGLENTRGIREVIINKWKLEDVVYRTRLPNLTVIPGGKAAVDFPEAFQSPGLARFFREVKSQYDLALYDSPPVNRYIDASLLSSAMDGVVLVVRSGHSRRQEVMAAKNEISTAGGQIRGVVMNDFRSPIPLFLARRL